MILCMYVYIHIFASRLTKTFKRSVWFSLVWSGFSLKKRKETRATSSMLVTFTVFKTENFKANNFESRNKLLLRPRFPNSRFDTARQKSPFYFWHFLRPSFSVQISNFYIFTLFSSFFRYFSSSFAIAIRGQDYFYPILNQSNGIIRSFETRAASRLLFEFFTIRNISCTWL